MVALCNPYILALCMCFVALSISYVVTPAIILRLLCTCSLILTYPEGVEMLRANGVEMGDEEDLRYV